MHRRIEGKLAIATPQARQRAGCANCSPLTASWRVRWRTRCLDEPDESRQDLVTSNRASVQSPLQRAAKLPAFADEFRPRVDVPDGAPGIYTLQRALGLSLTRISTTRWRGSENAFWHALGATRDGQRGAHCATGCCVACPNDHLEEGEAARRRHAGVAAARTAGFGYDRCSRPTALLVNRGRR